MGMKQMAALVVVAGFTLAVGCQQQGKPRSSKDVKGLNRVHFDFDSSEIRAESKKTLQNNASWLKKNEGTKVTIQGHCDERGTEEYNMALGHRRANAAKSYLSSLGIASARMKTTSYGEEKPLESCHNESCWWKNRRADFSK